MAYSSITKPSLHFNTVLFTGNGSTQSITGVGFQPDWVWIKNRDVVTNHEVADSVRGANKLLKPNDTDAEQSNSNKITSFDSDGFGVGNDANVNQSTKGIVGWSWLAGTSASGNTTGSGTAQSYTESYSTTAGFSIIAFTGNGTANHTLPHNLGVAPDWFIIKKRVGTGDATVRDWNVYHSSLGNTKRMVLNTTASVSTSNEYWNNTSPTSSVINLGTNDQINGNNNTYICYAFAEKKGYSKFGSYTGNGSTDGTFVYTGFKPAFTILKKSSGTDNWVLHDNKRSDVPNANVNDQVVYPNSSASELSSSTRAIDTVSNGFKCRGSGGNINASGETYIYMAFAESPFVSSGGIPTTAR
jgi:hypothetical protein